MSSIKSVIPEGTWFETLPTVKAQELIEKYTTEDAHSQQMEFRNDPWFGLFMRLVNNRLNHSVGLGYMDLEDYRYMDEYTDGLSPQEVAKNALAYAGFQGD